MGCALAGVHIRSILPAKAFAVSKDCHLRGMVFFKMAKHRNIPPKNRQIKSTTQHTHEVSSANRLLDYEHPHLGIPVGGELS